MMKRWNLRILFIALLVCFSISAYPFSLAIAEYTQQTDILYATHDGVDLLGDLYLPTTGGPHPAIMFIHGGAWRAGSKNGYGNNWGPYLAERGYVVFSIDYRLSTPTQTMWPQALLDCKAALQYLRGNAALLDVDPDRIGVGGDSAGGQLSSMLALTQDFPAFANQYPSDTFTNVSTKVKVVVPAYAVFDMGAWWKWTTLVRTDMPLEQLFGGEPGDLPGSYFEASPINYVRSGATFLDEVSLPNDGLKISWFVTYGMEDIVVPDDGQAIPFVKALKEAGADVTAVAVPGVGHFWFTVTFITGHPGISTCVTVPPPALAVTCSGATPNDFISSKLLRFLENNL